MQNTSSAVMQQRIEPHDSLDDFPTPSWAVRALIEHVLTPRWWTRQSLEVMSVREPCCNRGYMARPLGEYFGNVIATDIFNYGYVGHVATVDYLFPGKMIPADFTITNPPFLLAEQIIKKSFETPGWRGTAVLVRQSFLESEGRYETLFSKTPPTIYAQFAERVIITKGIVRDPSKVYWDEKSQKFRKPSTATSYCWLVWMDCVPPQPMVWIPPCRAKMERDYDYLWTGDAA